MNKFDKFNKVYLEILNDDYQNNQINESFKSKLATGALIGSTLFGALNAADLNNNSSKLNDNSNIIQTAQKTESSLNADELFIAKTIYSETSTFCTFEEIKAIACVIQNRIGLKDFGNCKNAIEVCKYPGAFSTVLKHNSNWDEYRINLNKFARFDAEIAKILVNPNGKLAGEPWMKDIVYYHDNSISKPSSWDNKYYRTILVKETKNFKFYKVEPKTKVKTTRKPGKKNNMVKK